MARAASSMSLNILGFTAAACAITSAVAASTFSSALQQGQVTSIVDGFFAILRLIPAKPRLAVKLDGEDAEDAEQLPAQQKNRNQDDEHRHEFTESKPAAVGLEAPRGQAQDVQRGEAENYSPQNVVNIGAPAG